MNSGSTGEVSVCEDSGPTPSPLQVLLQSFPLAVTIVLSSCRMNLSLVPLSLYVCVSLCVLCVLYMCASGALAQHSTRVGVCSKKRLLEHFGEFAGGIPDPEPRSWPRQHNPAPLTRNGRCGRHDEDKVHSCRCAGHGARLEVVRAWAARGERLLAARPKGEPTAGGTVVSRRARNDPCIACRVSCCGRCGCGCRLVRCRMVGYRRASVMSCKGDRPSFPYRSTVVVLSLAANSRATAVVLERGVI